MRRNLVALSMLAALAAGPPAHARPVTGTVRLAVVTATIPRTMYTSFGENGLTGYVFELPNGSSGKTFTLSLVEGATGREDLDAWFYSDLRGTGTICNRDARQQGTTETGTVTCSGARTIWAVVTLASGANARFSFSV